jgi:hypothetical protein
LPLILLPSRRVQIQGQALDEGFLTYLLTVNYGAFEPEHRKADVSLEEYVRVRSEAEDRHAKDVFLLSHKCVACVRACVCVCVFASMCVWVCPSDLPAGPGLAVSRHVSVSRAARSYGNTLALSPSLLLP